MSLFFCESDSSSIIKKCDDGISCGPDNDTETILSFSLSHRDCNALHVFVCYKDVTSRNKEKS